MEYGEQEDEEVEEDEEEEDGTEEEEEENGECVEEDDKPQNQMHYKCKHAVENSSRFSLRVMEAMRFLQSYENVLPISSVKDIVDYIVKNYNNDGDLYAQVRTALKQLCTHGFVVEVLKDEYQLIGPFGSSAMLETCNCEVDRSNSEIYSSTPKHTQLRRKFSKKCKKKAGCHCEKLQDELKLGTKREGSIFSDKDIALSRMDSLNNTMLATPKHTQLRRKFSKKCKKKTGCHCEKLQDELKLETKREGSIFSDKDIALSRMDSLNNTMLATPKHRVLRSRVKDNNVKMHSVTENITKHKRFADDIRDNRGNKSREHTPKRIRKINNDVAGASRGIEQHENTNLTPVDQVNENSRDNIFQGIKNLFTTKSQTREKELRKWIQRCRRECERQKKNN